MQERSNQILTGITLVLVTYFGWMLFKAMSEEVKVSEELTLMSRKLAGINEKLKELDHAKSEFISIASHQLRTPLTSVKGFTSLILDNTIGRIAPKQRKAVEKIYVNNEKLVMLVEDMLNASRLEAGRLEYELEEFDVTAIVAGTVDALKLYTKSKNLYLKFKKPEEKLTALVDQRKVAEIVANLIDNATKYTQKGGVTVTVEKFQREQRIGKAENTSTTNGHWARVSVADTGIGMAEKELESIFEKFKSGMATEMSKPDDKSTRNSQPPADEPGADNGDIKADYSTQSAGGTGLGVYISRQMAQAMGGKLYAESPGKNKGSTFILELPLVKKQK
jgi:signal transduction histidine kinase